MSPQFMSQWGAVSMTIRELRDELDSQCINGLGEREVTLTMRDEYTGEIFHGPITRIERSELVIILRGRTDD